ncbi:TIGR03943 family putative permease subunit [Geodermatophilus sp. SYSU D01119]
MDRLTASLVLLLLGGVTLRVSLTDAHLAYVQAGFRPFLLAAAVVLLVLGVIGAVRERPGRPRTPGTDDHGHDHDHDHGHGHGHGPRVAWLMLAPVAVLLLVAPPALGSFTAARQPQQVVADQPVAVGIGPDDPGEDFRTLPLSAYAIRALAQDTSAFEGRRVRLTGFVTPREGGGWYVTRIAIQCCAADAVAHTVVVDGPQGDLAADQWVDVVGTWAPPLPHPTRGWPEPVIAPESVTPVDPPADTYAD